MSHEDHGARGRDEADHELFARALAAMDSGEVATLCNLLDSAPHLTTARCRSIEPPYDGYFHGATLLHHVAGNPVRAELPANVVAMAEALLEAGADIEAGCGGGPSQPGPAGNTVLGLLTSGAQAHRQGLTEPLLDCLLEHGAGLDPEAGMWGTIYHVVEHQGQRDVARMLHVRGVRADLPMAAALGDLSLVASFFGSDGKPVADADAIWRRTVRDNAPATIDEMLADAVLAAATHGRTETVEWLLDRHAPLDQPRGWGPYTVTPLHGAAWADWPEVVTVLLERGADPTVREPNHQATPLDWAVHLGRTRALAAFAAADLRP